MLSREQHAEILAKILEQPDSANVSEMVTQLAENYASVLADSAVNGEQIATLKKQNDDLVQQNMKLFLKIGQGEPQDDTPKLEEERPVLKFDDLVNDNGHIF